jgi:hypothetical protein
MVVVVAKRQAVVLRHLVPMLLRHSPLQAPKLALSSWLLNRRLGSTPQLVPRLVALSSARNSMSSIASLATRADSPLPIGARSPKQGKRVLVLGAGNFGSCLADVKIRPYNDIVHVLTNLF